MSKPSLLYILCLVTTTLVPHVAAAFAWNSFPNCAQPCFAQYAPAACDHGVTTDLDKTNACLCSNQLFLDSAAVAIYIACGCVDLSLSANQMATNCNNTNTTAALNVDKFISIGDGNQSSCTQSFSPNNTPAAQSSTSSSNADLIIGLAVGIPAWFVALFAAVVAILQLLVTQRKIPEDASPWPMIRDSFRNWFCCCCGTRRGHKKPRMTKVPGDAA